MADVSDYAAYLIDAARSRVAVFHEFRLSVSDENAVHAFFEGDEDQFFFLPEVRRCAQGRSVNGYICGNKRRVVELREQVYHSDYSDQTCLFFLDRDLDDYLGCQVEEDANTYITESYSIENEVVGDVAFEILLVDFAKVSKKSAAYRHLAKNFHTGVVAFAQRLRAFMAFSLALRSKDLKPNVNNVDLRRLFDVRDDGLVLRKKEALSEFCKACGVPKDSVTFAELVAWSRRLPLSERKRWVRGKFELWFFETFLLAAISLLIDAGNKGVRIPQPLQQRRLIEALGAHLPASPALQLFLRNRLEQG